MKCEQVGNGLNVTVEEGDCDGDATVMVTVKEAGSKRIARAFFTAKMTKRGPVFKMVTKKNDFRTEVERTAAAHFDLPVHSQEG